MRISDFNILVFAIPSTIHFLKLILFILAFWSVLQAFDNGAFQPDKVCSIGGANGRKSALLSGPPADTVPAAARQVLLSFRAGQRSAGRLGLREDDRQYALEPPAEEHHPDKVFPRLLICCNCRFPTSCVLSYQELIEYLFSYFVMV